jgi:hypothetical protein
MGLPHDFVERARPQSFGERRRRLVLGKEIVHGALGPQFVSQ